MRDPEIIALKAEIAKLCEDLAELRQCSYQHFEMFTTHLVEQEHEIGDLFSYVMPMLRKLYPDIAATKKQYAAVLNRKPSRYIRDTDSKKS